MVYGQYVATGHISAEIVESVSATAPGTTQFGLPAAGSALSTGGEVTDTRGSEDVFLGEISIRSGAHVACQFVTGGTTMTDAAGNGLSIETRISGSQNHSTKNGNQTVQIKGVAHLTNRSTAGNYQGNYTLMLAYN